MYMSDRKETGKFEREKKNMKTFKRNQVMAEKGIWQRKLP